MNKQRCFDDLQKERLGKYVYALRDPRDKKIFYVGQGQNDRVFEHFIQAENCLKKNTSFNDCSSKVIRIMDIWKNNEDVEWLILSHNLPVESNIADYVESAIADSLSESQNGETLNEVTPPKSSRLLPDDILAMSADFVNPEESYKAVFVFSIQNALNLGKNPYDSTRSSWAVEDNNRLLSPSFAVGLKNSISKGSFKVLNWTLVNGTNRHEFIAEGHPTPKEQDQLLNKNWNNILAKAKGFWQRGNYLIVEFDGKGYFRICRGAQDKKNWHSCL